MSYLTDSLFPWPNSISVQLDINFISFKSIQSQTISWYGHTYGKILHRILICRRKFHLKISSFSSPPRNPRERRPSQSIEKELLVGHAHHNARFHLKKSSFSSSPSRNPREIRPSQQPAKTFEPMRLEETPPLLPLRVGERGRTVHTRSISALFPFLLQS